MARFTPDPGNPVIKSGGIWNRICATRNYTLCPERTASEGTPEISYKANGYYYVTFHGSYHTDKPNKYGVGPVINGYRGIAKTRDFHTWVVDSSGDIPDAPIWGPNDCAKWNVPWNSFTGCIGGGNAASLITPDYTYMLIESADTSLSCTAGQHWVEGLVRNPGANNFAASGKWQQLGDVVNRATPSDSAHPKNPLLNANTAAPCGIQYAAIFTDKDIVYMTYWVFPPTATNENVYFYISRLQPVTERR